MPAIKTPSLRVQPDFNFIFSRGVADRMSPHLKLSPSAPRIAAAEEVGAKASGIDAAKVEELAKVVSLAGTTVAMSASAGKVEAVEAWPARFWAAFSEAGHLRSQSYVLGGGVRRILVDVASETFKAGFGDAMPAEFSPASMHSYPDWVLVYGLSLLRQDLAQDLQARFAALGLKYPENPLGYSKNYFADLGFKLGAIPEVNELMKDPSFGIRFDSRRDPALPDRVQQLVFQALSLYPNTSAWMVEAVKALGLQPAGQSFFAPGGLDTRGGSVLLEAILGNPDVKASIGPAVTYARSSFLGYGDRYDPLVKSYESVIPWGLLGVLAVGQKSPDVYSAFQPVREIFAEKEGVLSKDQFYANVGVVFLRAFGDRSFQVTPDLYKQLVTEDLVTPYLDARSKKSEHFSTNVLGILREVLSAAIIHLPASQRSGVGGFLAAREEGAVLRSLGKFVSSEPYSTAIFSKDHALSLAKYIVPSVRELFSPASRKPSVDLGIPFTQADLGRLDKAAHVTAIVFDAAKSGLSYPFSLVQRLRDVEISAQNYACPDESVIDFLRGVSAGPVAKGSALSNIITMVRDSYLTTRASPFGDESGAQPFDMVQAVRSAARLAVASGEADPSVVRDLAVNELMGKLSRATSASEILGLVRENEALFLAPQPGEFSPAFAEGSVPFSLSDRDCSNLRVALSVPMGVALLNPEVEPSPYAVISAAAYFEQKGEALGSFWQPHVDSLKRRLAAGPVPVLRPGFRREERAVQPGLKAVNLLDAASGFLAVLGQLHGIDKDQVPVLPEPAQSVDFAELAPHWFAPEDWARSADEIRTLGRRVRAAFGPRATLDSVGSSLKLLSECSSVGSGRELFEVGSRLADALLKTEPVRVSAEDIVKELWQAFGLTTGMTVSRDPNLVIEVPTPSR